MHITDVVAEDLLFFSNLTRLDMSDNKASLEPFGCLPALVELDFQCNALEEVTLGEGFSNLEVLNLSFNCLKSTDVEMLANLVRIRELYLGSNQIRSLPPVMDRFLSLETLSLESNKISGQIFFSLLNCVPRLRNLNLSSNKITGFPESALTLEDNRGAGFYNLVYLNLAHNMIANEEAVVYTSELHSLRKLVLYGNPLAHAAVSLSDPTKLAYDPVPNLTSRLNKRTANEVAMTIVTAYPDTKKKKLHSMSCYEQVEIYKVIPNEVLLQSPFRTRATEFFQADHVANKEQVAKRQTDSPLSLTKKQLKHNISDSTFLTGVGIENIVMDARLSKELPAVPASVVARSLALESRNIPTMNTRMAVNALRYQLEHPLSDDYQLDPAHSQQLTKASIQRQRPRRPLPSRKDLQTLPSSRHFNGLKSKDAQNVDDALTKLSSQVSSAWDKRPKLADKSGQRVDSALESLIMTAKKLDLTYSRSS